MADFRPTNSEVLAVSWLIVDWLMANTCRLVTKYTFTCITSSFLVRYVLMCHFCVGIMRLVPYDWVSQSCAEPTSAAPKRGLASLADGRSECSAQNCETCLMLIWARWANWFPLLGSQFFFQKGPWLIVVLVKFSLLVVLDVSIECIHLYSTGYKKLAQPVTYIPYLLEIYFYFGGFQMRRLIGGGAL